MEIRYVAVGSRCTRRRQPLYTPRVHVHACAESFAVAASPLARDVRVHVYAASSSSTCARADDSTAHASRRAVALRGESGEMDGRMDGHRATSSCCHGHAAVLYSVGSGVRCTGRIRAITGFAAGLGGRPAAGRSLSRDRTGEIDR